MSSHKNPSFVARIFTKEKECKQSHKFVKYSYFSFFWAGSSFYTQGAPKITKVELITQVVIGVFA